MRFLLPLVASAASTEQYLRAPFASEVSAAHGGGKLVWLLNERGARNPWVAAAPDYRGRRLIASGERRYIQPSLTPTRTWPNVN